MSEVFLQKTIVPCIINPVIVWHLNHGWVFNAVDRAGKPIGVVYCTLLGGDGCIVHFEILPGVSLAQIRSGFSKTFRLLAPCGRLLATVPAEKRSLIKLLVRFGFNVISPGKMVLLQYSKRAK